MSEEGLAPKQGILADAMMQTENPDVRNIAKILSQTMLTDKQSVGTQDEPDYESPVDLKELAKQPISRFNLNEKERPILQDYVNKLAKKEITYSKIPSPYLEMIQRWELEQSVKAQKKAMKRSRGQ